MNLEVGDILGYKPHFTKNWLAALVKLGARQEYTHVMIYLGDNQIIEAGPKGIGIRALPEMNEKEWEVRRLKRGLTKTQMEKVMNHSHSFEGRIYAFHQAILLFLYKWFNKKFPMIKGNIFLNCSEFISRVFYNALEVDLSKESHDYTSPDDIMYSKELEEIQ